MRLLVILVWCMSCADDHPTAIPIAHCHSERPLSFLAPLSF